MSSEHSRQMVTNPTLHDIQTITYVSTNNFIGGEFTDKVNEYLKNGWRLLHVGEETDHCDKGLWHSTVAVLGR